MFIIPVPGDQRILAGTAWTNMLTEHTHTPRRRKKECDKRVGEESTNLERGRKYTVKTTWIQNYLDAKLTS